MVHLLLGLCTPQNLSITRIEHLNTKSWDRGEAALDCYSFNGGGHCMCGSHCFSCCYTLENHRVIKFIGRSLYAKSSEAELIGQ